MSTFHSLRLCLAWVCLLLHYKNEYFCTVFLGISYSALEETYALEDQYPDVDIFLNRKSVA